jgi:hypothetical protein
MVFEKDNVRATSETRKQHGVPRHPKNVVTTKRQSELLHMDLFGPLAYISISGNKYGLVIIDNFFASLGFSFCVTKVKPNKS